MMRFFAFLLFFLTAAAWIQFPAAASAQPLPPVQDLKGIHYAPLRNALDPDELQHTYDCQAPCTVEFDDRLSAVYLRYKWGQLNPSKGVYDFSLLADAFPRVIAADKKITLIIMAGKYTPAWVIEEGAAHQPMPVKNFGPSDHSQEYVPAYWDPIFQNAYLNFHKVLAEYLRSQPGFYDALVMIKNGGPVVHSSEVRMMPVKAFIGKHFSDAQREATAEELCEGWVQVGYTEDRMVEALATLNHGIIEAFPDKYLGLAFVSGSQRFPTVSADGTCQMNKVNHTMSRLIKSMVKDLGSRAVINNTTLYKDGGHPPIMGWVRKNGGQIGFQVNREEVGCRKGNPKGCNKDAFHAAIQTGIDEGALFIEVHDGDIHRYKAYLKKANTTLTAP